VLLVLFSVNWVVVVFRVCIWLVVCVTCILVSLCLDILSCRCSSCRRGDWKF